jgi:hypothetical protein
MGQGDRRRPFPEVKGPSGLDFNVEITRRADDLAENRQGLSPVGLIDWLGFFIVNIMT